MCGFLTEFSFGNHGVINSTVFEELLRLSKHRGPDNTTISAQQNYRLGFNRLAILDLSAQGNQPKYSPSQRYHVVFNGEIYNYKALQEQYKLNNLNSTSDTEVLIHLLDVLGVYDALKVLNGMFAIAVVDTKTNALFLARDFAGIKPLFYGVSDLGVVAASQFNQIFRHPWFKETLELRPDIIKEYFGFGYMQAPNTIYNNIYQVRPGECLKIQHGEAVERRLFYKAKTKTNDVFESTIKPTLEAAVKRQLVSHVPLASFLSGGIDSPLITAMAKKEKSDLEAFTLSVNHKALDEGQQAFSYAKEVGVKQQIHKVNEEDLLAVVNEHFKFMGEPFGDYSSIPTYLIAKKAKVKHTVMLSGDGGDELFFGYPRMLDVYNKRHWFKIPYLIRKPLVRLANKLNLTNTWGPYHYKHIGDWVMGRQAHVFKKDLDGFLNDTDYSEEFRCLYDFHKATSKNDMISQLRLNEFYGHMQRVLVKVDRMSMAHGLEVRVPFLDKQVIDDALSKQPKSFRSQTDLKKVLKTLMLDYYSPSSINNKKQGFAVPMFDWLHGYLKADVEEVVLQTPFYGASHINEEAVKDYVKQFFKEKHDAAWGVWHIYAWQKWAIGEGLV
ncbi:asparagine synthase (glutamine-hydrolyzing) [Seonamhaeicola sediminis]|uniref:asparagine synthase (glutamine-hydrolyzing) n=1 Tax=Seonamhaeicola sediminis TaxID=2528206 RepID=A0A562YH31_9FLAO|nr:asparagine synthase (glutamine-hydrolyzing) [Seonamhaeicola sediminis]TWO34370.1 asparagine synthase (glutamine-hydrolyzing) [Seonamhaeicola sediminis]